MKTVYAVILALALAGAALTGGGRLITGEWFWVAEAPPPSTIDDPAWPES